MDMTLTEHHKTLVVKIIGELDHHYATRIRETIDIEIKDKDIRLLIFDLSALEFMDSSGIGVIMGRLRLMKQQGGKVCVAGAKDSLNKIICLSGLSGLIGIYHSVEEAMKGGQVA